MDEWARFLGLDYYSVRMMAVGRVVRTERFRTLMHFWLEFPDRCTRCRTDQLVGAAFAPAAVLKKARLREAVAGRNRWARDAAR